MFSSSSSLFAERSEMKRFSLSNFGDSSSESNVSYKRIFDVITHFQDKKLILNKK
jgi:hypothetical protein